MYRNVLEFHGLTQDLDHDDFYPTEAITELTEDVKFYLKSRPLRFAVLSGSVSVGKTTIVNLLVEEFKSAEDFTIAFMAHNDAARSRRP